jgi:hypothetical protein
MLLVFLCFFILSIYTAVLFFACRAFELRCRLDWPFLTLVAELAGGKAVFMFATLHLTNAKSLLFSVPPTDDFVFKGSNQHNEA